jgi:hypothetical protein
MFRTQYDPFYGPPPHPLQSALARFLKFLDERTANEWLAFGVGVILGCLL